MSLKDYEILNKLGSGSFGVVYKAKPKGGDPICVLKEVQLKSMDKKMREWAMNEVKIMKNIDSEYIVKYKQSFIEKQKLYICMEYCSGGDLAQFLKGQMGKPVAEDIVWRFALQIMLGLRDLHRKKILHRDIKSMNVFLNENRTIKIGDLGVAKTMTGDFARTIVGTPYYLSPEMCQQKPYNQKTDVWAMGCLIYELCTGKHPFQANTQAALALKIVMGKYAPIPSLYSQLMSWLIRVCLQIDYKRRPTVQYILDQANVISMAKKVGIQLSQTKLTSAKEPAKEKVQVNKEKIEVAAKPTQKAQKVQSKFSKNQIIDSKVTKKNFKQQVKRPSVERNKAKSIQKNAKGVNISANQKDVKAEQKGYGNLYNKNLPPKEAKKPENVEVKRIQAVNKLNNKGHISPSAKNIPQIKQQVKEAVKQVPLADQKPKPKKIQPKREEQQSKKQAKEDQQNLLPLQSKPRKSVQQVVDDDQLFNDFGITPEKLSTFNDKFEFKKVNPINWNIEPENGKKLEKTLLRELPTIKTPSGCDLVQIQCKQIEDEEQIVAEEIDDNAPYKSEDQIDAAQFSQDNTLVENSQEMQEDAQLKKKEKLLILQKRMNENDKRRKELVQLKRQRQKQIIAKLSVQKYEKIKAVMKDGSDEDIQKMLTKECSNVSITAQFYKIIYNQMEIERCQDNINKCIQTIKEMDHQK